MSGNRGPCPCMRAGFWPLTILECPIHGDTRGHELDRLRARVAELEAAGDRCADELEGASWHSGVDAQEAWNAVRAGSVSPDDAPTTEPNPAGLLSLDELTANVENALECAAIEVVVWETDTTGARTIESPHPMYRLARCLRSYGLLDERRDPDEDAGDDTTETRVEWRVTAVIPSGGEVAEEFFFEDDAKDQAGRWRACAWHDIRIWSRTVSTTTRTTAWKADQ